MLYTKHINKTCITTDIAAGGGKLNKAVLFAEVMCTQNPQWIHFHNLQRF